jgi:hypothetical protein
MFLSGTQKANALQPSSPNGSNGESDEKTQRRCRIAALWAQPGACRAECGTYPPAAKPRATRAFIRLIKPRVSLVCPDRHMVGWCETGPPVLPLAIKLARLLQNTALYTKELHRD